jgi:D-apiose dehydrogenase
MPELRGVAVGAGYFSRFHYDAWARIPEARLTALCDVDAARANAVRDQYGIPRVYSDHREMFAAERPDFVDVITPPATHLEICRDAAQHGIHIICQKPLAPTFDDAKQLVAHCAAAGSRLMVHENFRFQPWHREIKRLLETGAIGTKLHSLTFRARPGDGWGSDAYLNRQPYFRTMPRFLIVETGIHFIDTFRFLAGEVASVYAVLRKLNPVIVAEDCGLLIFEFASGAVGVWDCNRYNESNFDDPRYTFGEFLVEGDGGSIRLYGDGRLTIQTLGDTERPHEYMHQRTGFAGDCVHAAQRHFVERILDGAPFETDGTLYLKNLEIQEALYRAAEQQRPVPISVT